MLGFLSKILLSAGSKLAPKTAKMMLEKVGIKTGADAAKLSKKELLKKLGVKEKSLIGSTVKTGAAAGAGAYGSSILNRADMTNKAEGGYVKMKRGGAVKKRAKSSSKKSRGTGAAIKGTKFKGVF